MTDTSQQVDTNDIDSFWGAMHSAYGHRWARQFGNKPNRAWSLLLANFTNSQLQEAFKLLVDKSSTSRADGWPPSLPEFRGLLENVRDRSKGLEPPEQPNVASPEVGLAHIASIRHMLKQSKD